MEQRIFKIFKNLQSDDGSKNNRNSESSDSENSSQEKDANEEASYKNLEELLLMDSTELERIVFKMKRTVESTEIGIPESIKF